MSEEHDESIQLEQVTELAPKPKRVYKKSTKQSDNPLPPAISPEPSPPPSIPTEQPVKEKKARTQKQIDAFNKMREAYLNKRKTPNIEPIIEPVSSGSATVSPIINDSPNSPDLAHTCVKGMTQHVSVNELGTKKVQKPRAKKIKHVATEEEPQINPVISQSPATIRQQVSTSPRFLFV